MRGTPGPDFFIVGAPKCGSGSLWRYLAGHPQVFMSAVKEPNHFGSDVRSELTVRDRDAYLRLFADAGDARAIGEASVRYLRSRDAAAEIAAFDGRARIVALVREPVAQMRSLHNHFVARGIEDITDLGAALTAGTKRFHRRRVGRPINPDFLDYREAARYAPQLERYLAAFPASQVHVIVTEELAADTAGAFRELLRFLAVDDMYQPSFERHNASRRTRHPGVARWLVAPPTSLRRLSRRVPAVVRRVLWRDLIRRPLYHATSEEAPVRPIDRALEVRLRAEMEPDVQRLAVLIGRPDLPARWGYEPARGPVDGAVA